MTPESEKLQITKTRLFKVDSTEDLQHILYDLITKNFTGQVRVNLSQGGYGPVLVEEKLKPST